MVKNKRYINKDKNKCKWKNQNKIIKKSKTEISEKNTKDKSPYTEINLKQMKNKINLIITTKINGNKLMIQDK